MDEGNGMHWLVYRHECNEWDGDTRQLVYICNSKEEAERRQNEVFEEFVELFRTREEAECMEVHSYVKSVTWSDNKDAFFRAEIEEIRNK